MNTYRVHIHIKISSNQSSWGERELPPMNWWQWQPRVWCFSGFKINSYPPTALLEWLHKTTNHPQGCLINT